VIQSDFLRGQIPNHKQWRERLIIAILNVAIRCSVRSPTC